MIGENNSWLGALNKLKFSITSVCLRPIFLDFFTNLVLKSFVSVCLFAFGLYFKRMTSKILTSVLDLQCHTRNSFQAVSKYASQ